MSDEQIDRGLTAFIDGQSGSWSSCFFARAFGKELQKVRMKFGGENLMQFIAHELGLPDDSGVVMVIQMFDHNHSWFSKQDLKDFISKVRDERHTTRTIDELLASLPKETFTTAPNLEVLCHA